MKISFYTILTLFIFFTSCSKGDSDGGNENPPPPVYTPAASTLTLPANNEACTSGVSTDANNATITFSWQAATNAETYDLVVKNLSSTKQTTYPVSATTKDIVLSIGQPYSWYVVSKSSKTTVTTQSEVWKFYVAGNPTSSYAPFPATLIAPSANSVINSGGMQTNVVLQWKATDVDNDIASYAIYLDNKDASTTVVPLVSTDTTSVSLTPGTTYYWRVVTTDSVGNNSSSGISSFVVQ